MRNLLLHSLLLLALAGRPAKAAGPGVTTAFIKVDQFGYRPNAQKVAVVVDPQVGYNADESFGAATGANQYQVRRWDDDAVVLTGTLTAHQGGATHAQSGDRGWWFDFSALTAPGSYYVFDVGNNVGSYRFEVGEGVYDEVLRQAVRTFYYQRVGFAKATPYTAANWADAASHLQDSRATDLAGNNPRDLSGGWYDAGDYNKYVTFTAEVVPVLLEAYRANPGAFPDTYNLPESGNGVPDLLDEVKWELDWLKRMQDATGTGGLFLKVGAINYDETTPPSTDARPRYYYGECTSATLTGALDFAVAALVYKDVPAYASYGQDLQARAAQAWTRAATTTASFTSFQTACDDGTIKAGDADVPQTSAAPEQLQLAVAAAVYLYELTGEASYRTFVEANYAGIPRCNTTYWNAYRAYLSTALLRYSQLGGATAAVKANILANFGTDYADGDFGRGAWANATDLYRAPMPDFAYRWGSNAVKATAGMLALDKARYLAPANAATYTAVAEGFAHYLHGVNPQGLVYLSNMGAFGAEKSVQEFYHIWFSNGSPWDNAQTSAQGGPAPGYLTGGPNYWYVAEGGGSATIAPPAGQPHQKAYKDWNTNWNGSFSEASYAVTENGIYYQAKYINLLARLIGPGRTPASTPAPAPAPAPTAAAFPGRIEAEAYAAMSGVQTEDCADAGGGRNVGYVDQGDWLDYAVRVASAGTYTLDFRVATPEAGRQFELRSGTTVLATVDVPNTGGWQSWQTVSKTVTLPAGTQTLRLLASSGSGWNLNWLEGRAALAAATGPVRYEAEQAALVGTAVATGLGGYSGTGYVDGLDAPGDRLTFAVTVPAAGSYPLRIRYAACQNQQNFVRVNGSGVSQAFAASSCAQWLDKSLSVALSAGSNTVVIEKDWGWMPVDYIEVGACTSCTAAVALAARPAAAARTTGRAGLAYPNPTRGPVRLALAAGEWQLQVTDLLGRVVLARAARVSGNGATFDLSQLPPGAYRVQATSAGQRLSQRVVLER